MRTRICRKPARVQLTPTFSQTIREPGTSTEAAIRKAALERSPGTWTWSIPSVSVRCTAETQPAPASRSRVTGAPAAASIRSV